MISRFFIERPILANVIAILTIILGVVAVLGLPVAQYPEITPPTVQVTATYPGASARVVADTIALPIEQQVNGVRGHALHAVDERQRRHLQARHHLQGRHRPGHGPGSRPEPRRDRLAPVAPGRAETGGRHQEGVHRHPAGHRPLFPRGALRQPVPQQLRLDQPAGRARAAARGGRCERLRRRPVQHAGVAGPRDAQDLQPRPERRHQRHPAAEPPGAGRPGGHAAGAGRPELPVYGERRRPAGRDRGVREHHRQDRDRPGRPDHPGQGRRPRRAGRPDLQPVLQVRRPTQRGRRHLPAARRQRPAGGRRGRQGHGRARQELPPGPQLRHPLRHDRFHPGLHPRGVQDPVRGRRPGAARHHGLPAETGAPRWCRPPPCR